MTYTLACCPRGHPATLFEDKVLDRITISCVYCEGETVYRNCTVEQAVSEWNRRASPADLGVEEKRNKILGQKCADYWAEIERLREALENIASARPIWNGGVTPHRPGYLYDFIKELQEIARAALAASRTEMAVGAPVDLYGGCLHCNADQGENCRPNCGALEHHRKEAANHRAAYRDIKDEADEERWLHMEWLQYHENRIAALTAAPSPGGEGK